MSLNQKKILFISVSFFGYEKEINKKLIEYGACVDFFDERFSNTKLVKILLRVFKNRLRAINNFYFRIIYKKIKKKNQGL